MTFEVELKGRRRNKASMLSQLKAEALVETEKTKSQLVRKLADATPVDTGEARDGWRKTPKGVENPVEHIKPLNEGSSKQAPSHFIERTVLAHRGVSPGGIIVRHK